MAGGENPGAGRPAEKLGSLSTKRRRGFANRRRIHGMPLFAVRSSDGVLAEGGGEEREVVSGGRRSGGLFHDEVAQGRGRKELAAPRR